uniref:Trace amine-associated receptor 9-like n=1 Tax=Phallusia mammillata TaxID=59560 RepID=A0A6F9DV74_9ASCI|nr:trace amine-associated receptor 9-like [Phallusia mammillata]
MWNDTDYPFYNSDFSFGSNDSLFGYTDGFWVNNSWYEFPNLGAGPPVWIWLTESVETGNVTLNKTVIQLCGFPAFCSEKAYNACANTPLCACAECSKTGAGFFVFFVVLLGLACVFGNVLVMAVLKKLGLLQSFNKMKFSLAVADFLTGVQLLVVSIYNFSWTMNVSSSELQRRQIELTGTPEATVGGIFLLLTFTCSLYHLVYMRAQRLYAIRWPLSYRMQSDFHVYVGLAMVWGLALVSSTMPAWFPGSIIYTYQHTIFLFYVSNTNKPHTGSYTGLVVLMVVFFVIPYLAMLFTTMATMVTVRGNIKKSKQLSHRSSDKKSKQELDHSKREIKIFVVVGLMQLGFTITIIPVILVNILFYENALNCNNISLPFMICFYLGMTNSLVNVIIYSFRDKTFNKATKKLFAVSSCCKQQKKETYSTVSHTSGKTASTTV